MNMGDGVVIGIEVNRMRTQIKHHLMDRYGEIQRMVDSAVDSFDLKREIERQVREQLPIVMRETVKRALESAVWDSGFRQQLTEMVRESLVESAKTVSGSEAVL